MKIRLYERTDGTEKNRHLMLDGRSAPEAIQPDDTTRFCFIELGPDEWVPIETSEHLKAAPDGVQQFEAFRKSFLPRREGTTTIISVTYARDYIMRMFPKGQDHTIRLKGALEPDELEYSAIKDYVITRECPTRCNINDLHGVAALMEEDEELSAEDAGWLLAFTEITKHDRRNDPKIVNINGKDIYEHEV
jgi:hypothetical protein